MSTIRVACVGAGNIAEAHAAVLRGLPAVSLAAVVDPVASRARSFAEKWGIANVYISVDELIAARAADVAHVLVPPPLHKTVAEPLLAAGLHVLLEKPMAQSEAECVALQDAAARSGAALRVNHNAVFQPAQRKLRRLLEANRIGPVRHVACRFNLPLRQLGTRQLGHWMFNTPLNLLLEQAVHPLSQIDDLVGPAQAVAALAQPPLHLGEGQDVFRSWLISLDCARGSAQLLLSLGESYPSWGVTVIGDDGAVHVDYLANSVTCEASGPRMEPFNSFGNVTRMSAAAQGQAFVNLIRSAASMARITARQDPFYISMRDSITRFHGDLAARRDDMGGAVGRRMVALCERIADAAGLSHAVPAPAPAAAATNFDVLLIGGTGFIGAHVVPKLLADGHRVGVLARNTANLPRLFADPRVALIRGDARKAEDVAAAIGTAPFVIDLAHGGGGASRAEIEASIVGSARVVAEACLDRKVHRLVFASSIAALYLGDPSETVTGATPPDREPDARADYARGKVLAERVLLDLHHSRGLPVTILRPGLVIGAGGTPFHSGVGFYNQETHCLGWNRGRNLLPLVLAEEVADALVLALSAPGIEGKCFNIVGDIRLTAREYVAQLARTTGRPLAFHPQSVLKLYAIEVAKVLVKRAGGRRELWPSLRDLKSRGLVARFDCTDAMRALGWHPVRDRETFLRQGFAAHGHHG